MWHASSRSATKDTAWAIAERALNGVGDATLGEWREYGTDGSDVVHIRRRLSRAEAKMYRVKVRDIRGSKEEEQRLVALLTSAPHLIEHVRHAYQSRPRV